MASSTQKHDLLSRKFLTTNYAMSLGAGITVLSMYSSPPEGFFTGLAGLYILLAAGIAAYNWSNLRESQNGSAPK